MPFQTGGTACSCTCSSTEPRSKNTGRTNLSGYKAVSFKTERQKVVSINGSCEVKEEQEGCYITVPPLILISTDLNVFVNPR